MLSTKNSSVISQKVPTPRLQKLSQFCKKNLNRIYSEKSISYVITNQLIFEKVRNKYYYIRKQTVIIYINKPYWPTGN
jgi:hypothetical protein